MTFKSYCLSLRQEITEKTCLELFSVFVRTTAAAAAAVHEYKISRWFFGSCYQQTSVTDTAKYGVWNPYQNMALSIYNGTRKSGLSHTDVQTEIVQKKNEDKILCFLLGWLLGVNVCTDKHIRLTHSETKLYSVYYIVPSCTMNKTLQCLHYISVLNPENGALVYVVHLQICLQT